MVELTVNSRETLENMREMLDETFEAAQGGALENPA